MKRSRILFLSAAGCVLLGLCTRYLLIGYQFSAWCLWALAAVLVFYGLMARWGTKAARVLSILGGVVLAAGFGLFLAAEIPVWKNARSAEDTEAPYLIVFGAAVHGQTPSLSMVERTTAALQWLEEHPGGVAVLSGGQGGGEELSEARAMYDWLTARGVAPDRLLMESLSTSSYENLLFSLRVIADHGGDPGGRVALCSSEYHLYRLCTIARALDCEPVPVAARTGHVTLRLNYAVREAFGIWRIWVLGLG